MKASPGRHMKVCLKKHLKDSRIDSLISSVLSSIGGRKPDTAYHWLQYHPSSEMWEGRVRVDARLNTAKYRDILGPEHSEPQIKLKVRCTTG